MKIIHISPTYFDEGSIIGGGERYPTELAFWMSKVVDTTLVSFSTKRETYHRDNLRIEIYPIQRLIYGNKSNPLCFRYLKSILNFDVNVVHIHQINTLVSDLSCWTASLLRKKVFGTDYGGGGALVLNQKLPIFSGYKNAITYSRYGIDYLPVPLRQKAILIKGGIDTDLFCPDESLAKEKKILYVGRILPHKGINYLIEGFRLLDNPEYKLKIIGRIYSDRFYTDLRQLAEGLNVEFVHNADDEQLLYEYRTARITVLPSVHTTCYGDYTPVPELMGFTLLESQACGTPVICTDAGAMSEFVENEKTGLVVEQNSGEAIREALNAIISKTPESYQEMQNNCRQWITHLNWISVVDQHLKIYQT